MTTGPAGRGIERAFNDRYSTPLLIAATTYFMTFPAPVLAHGPPPVVATFIFSFLALALVAPTLTDLFAIKRWLFKDRARLAAILANLTAAAVAIPLFSALQWVGGAAATALESGAVRAAYWLRTLSPWPEGLITIAAMAATKAAILRWRFREPLSRRTIGLLFLSTLAGMCVAAAIAALLAYATTHSSQAFIRWAQTGLRPRTHDG
jgi:hypothetical protein